MTRHARTSRALAVTGATTVLCSAVLGLGPVLTPVSAADAPGSALGFYKVSAKAPAVQLRIAEPSFCYSSPAGKNGCELVLPESTSRIGNGPTGSALAAVIWPGGLAADIGSLLITASNGAIPDSARMLNDPVRAEAETSSDHEKASNTSVQGTSMTATANSVGASSDASISQSQANPAGSFGKITGTTNVDLAEVQLTRAVAHSKVNDVALAGGVVKIDSVVSDAVATTDGKLAKASGKTVVTGMSIAGVPVRVDGNGVTAMGVSPVPLQTAQQVVNTALANLGMKIVLGPPQQTGKGAGTDYFAGSLVIFWNPPAPPPPVPLPGGTTFTVTLGGAAVSVDADPALAAPTGPDAPAQPPTTVTPVEAPPSGGGTSVPPTFTGGTTQSPPLAGTELPPLIPGAPAGPAPATTDPVVAASAFGLPDGVSPVAVVLGLLGSLLFMAGMRRLPDRVLSPGIAGCPLEENR